MALQYVGYASAATTSVALPAFTAGDLALVAAYRDGSNTAATLPAGWTNIWAAGADTNSLRIGYRVLQGGDTTTGVWTSATEVQVLVVRGQHPTAPIGTGAVYGAASSSLVAYQSVQIFGDPVRSWVVGFAGHRTATNVNSGVISGMATRSAGSGTPSVCCHTQADTFRHEGDYPSTTLFPSDTAPDTYWFDGIGFTANATAAWRSYAFELLEATSNQTMTQTVELSLTPAQVPVARTAHKLIVRARKTNAAHTGVIRLQLFEGLTPRSALLITSPVLTTTMTDYTVNIADGDAALIGNYADLNVHFNGYSSEGTPTVFEVDQVWLEIPEAAPLVQAPPVFPNVVLFAVIEGFGGSPVGEDIFPAPTLFPSETTP